MFQILKTWNWWCRISVMAAYRPHVKTIKSVRDGTRVVCTTVHKMLGAENDIVILATTRSNSSRDLGFMNQLELLNATYERCRRIRIQQ
jgi:superfamily I DNA and/or RNA helicase